MNMNQIFNVGDKIGNYCNGYFGRDDYENKTCVMISPTYAVFEYDDLNGATILNYSLGLEHSAKGDNWKPTTDDD